MNKKYIIVKDTLRCDNIKNLIKTFYQNTLQLAIKYNNQHIVDIIQNELNKLDSFNINQLNIELNYKEIKKYYDQYKIIILN